MVNSYKLGSKRFILLIAPLFMSFYFSVIVLEKWQRSGEYFPFFSWSLFSHPLKPLTLQKAHSKDFNEPIFFHKDYILIHSIDGVEIPYKNGLLSIGEKGIFLQKNIDRVMRFCNKTVAVACENEANKFLSGYLSHISYSQNIVYSSLVCYVNTDYYIHLLSSGIDKFPKHIKCQNKTMSPKWTVKKSL